MCDSTFRITLSETFLILRRMEGDMIKNVRWFSRYVPSVLSYFNETWNLTDFSKNTPISNFMKIRAMVAELFQSDGLVDGRTYKHKDGQT